MIGQDKTTERPKLLLNDQYTPIAVPLVRAIASVRLMGKVDGLRL